jgi:predicted lipoprotein
MTVSAVAWVRMSLFCLIAVTVTSLSDNVSATPVASGIAVAASAVAPHRQVNMMNNLLMILYV